MLFERLASCCADSKWQKDADIEQGAAGLKVLACLHALHAVKLTRFPHMAAALGHIGCAGWPQCRYELRPLASSCIAGHFTVESSYFGISDVGRRLRRYRSVSSLLLCCLSIYTGTSNDGLFDIVAGTSPLYVFAGVLLAVASSQALSFRTAPHCQSAVHSLSITFRSQACSMAMCR